MDFLNEMVERFGIVMTMGILSIVCYGAFYVIRMLVGEGDNSSKPDQKKKP